MWIEGLGFFQDSVLTQGPAACPRQGSAQRSDDDNPAPSTKALCYPLTLLSDADQGLQDVLLGKRHEGCSPGAFGALKEKQPGDRTALVRRALGCGAGEVPFPSDRAWEVRYLSPLAQALRTNDPFGSDH